LSAPQHTNRLAGESSPYLQQHAHNPVDWYPWGEEALGRARAEDKPIFLSIGYAACHWCHVMERESFEDESVAAFLNQYFVAIKVDREERPDIDAVYMSAVQAMTGGGGWPLSAFLTPQGRPFFAGTYFPPVRRWGSPSFTEVLQAIAEAWMARRAELADGAEQLTSRLAPSPPAASPAELDPEAAEREAVARLERLYDLRWGGFGGAPKFPTPSRLFFLLRLAAGGEAGARQMLAGTLDGMAAGGMFDWVGGGFHRYSVDASWLVPHFEKMLYDNALLARAYGEAGLRLERPQWTRVARETAAYLIAEMQGEEGGFFSSTDADSEGEEGRFFTWTAAEVRDALPAGDADLVVKLCGLDGGANFEHGRNVLRPQLPLEELSRLTGVAEDELAQRLEGVRRALYRARTKRPRPERDDKRLAGWNGMAAWALARLGAVFEEDAILSSARRAGDFLLSTMIHSDYRLVRSWRDGSSSGAEALEDVAWVATALVELYQAEGERRWLEAALRLVLARVPHYRDAAGALYETPDDGEALIVRPRDPIDGATPAPAAILASALIDLAALTGRRELLAWAEAAVGADTALATRLPESATALLGAAVRLRTPPTTVVVVGDPEWDSTRALRRAARRHAPPGCVLALSPTTPVPPELVELVPLFAGRERVEGRRARAYLCHGTACLLPTAEPAELARVLQSS
jgi:uncharacterized protein